MCNGKRRKRIYAISICFRKYLKRKNALLLDTFKRVEVKLRVIESGMVYHQLKIADLDLSFSLKKFLFLFDFKIIIAHNRKDLREKCFDLSFSLPIICNLVVSGYISYNTICL